ncbi:membrane-spanning 4-domains subfamily A member 15-like isoform 1-T5 [Clarias gariepinus]|uniref:membrane-spanning 4-domains subfamily A member 15-like n=1 Tax=Clarias gariepinus TaxID=13013 RepID=UPI00234D5F94|nr:membrane-spanning 4-domains subfamily A member 15-like [Clarias gariepinus]XP_053354959.1 membrane-spanning 4-domains subfamily A member 15-like [Clarias gariepinus]XP_053354960.1 membrane-spanning 4-domains subfamily A member 15-like [Clarias gariepinus]XP_053354961.1 membrane-spanning 4-domains subfamily A member 15-like [Clarias gariepinus]XP_053354962.1 membrane-spanning 4-domains subfamily A member 15-like [Clarias gariepinus]XP_053354963.1 membrane-spanning 4-domains subfamily A membe
MASAQRPVTNIGAGYTIVTQVIPSSTAQRTTEQNCPQSLSPLQTFLKGEPKALGAVQIINGLWMLLISLVEMHHYGGWFGHVIWSSVIHIISGSLTVLASKSLGPCAVRGAMALNILSAISTANCIASISLKIMYSWSYLTEIPGILLVFSLLQFAIAISVTVFACKARRSNQPILNVLPMVPNPEGYVSVNNSLPAHHAYPGINASNAVSMSSTPVESPPPYSSLR